jgi:predicted NBD/HSP70 family sugar kinase
MKGKVLGEALRYLLGQSGPDIPVEIVNDADVMAAGIAATRGQLDKLIRAWTIGSGIGFGRYPQAPGVWEGGHSVVTLDAKEQFCRCGGAGHLEGIMGERAMRLRFMDLEPDESSRWRQKGYALRDLCQTLASSACSGHSDEHTFGGSGKVFYFGDPMRILFSPTCSTSFFTIWSR